MKEASGGSKKPEKKGLEVVSCALANVLENTLV
jgi:hypothetical protein